MTDVSLSDNQWTKVRDFLRDDPHAYVGNEADCRRFVDAVKWVSRSSACSVSELVGQKEGVK
jgi:hypothetical protein